MPQKKALLIGINYYGSEHQLEGCINDCQNVQEFLVNDRGFSAEDHHMVVMTDEPQNEGTPYFPTGVNILNAIQWLTSHNRPGDVLWLSYSGHGAQVPDEDRPSGMSDTICPVDFEQTGQITSEILHRNIITPLHPECRLTILFDCCHSGSACELPFVYRPDAEGNVNPVDTLRKGVGLFKEAQELLRGGFSMDKMDDAKQLLGGATDFWNGLHHQRSQQLADEDGLAPEEFAEWEGEAPKDVWMFSGCADDQTSADTSIAGAPTGAMSWAFVRTMREEPEQSYINILQNSRHELARKYAQIPQLSCGGEFDLDQTLIL